MAGFIDTSEFRNGLKIEIDGEPFEIVYFQHVKPGKGSAFVRTKIRSLLSGRVLEPTMKSGDKVGLPDIEEKDMQYLYASGRRVLLHGQRRTSSRPSSRGGARRDEELPEGEHQRRRSSSATARPSA